MKRKLIPPFLMLFAGAVSSIIMVVLQYETKSMLMILIGILIGFYIMGSLFKWMLDIFEKQNEEPIIEEKEIVSEEQAEEMDEGQVNAEG